MKITDICDDVLDIIQQQVLIKNRRITRLNQIERDQRERKKYINFIFGCLTDMEIGSSVEPDIEVELRMDYAGTMSEDNVCDHEIDRIMYLLYLMPPCDYDSDDNMIA